MGVDCSSLWRQGHWWQKPQTILISISSPRGPYFDTKTKLHPIAYRLQSWKVSGQTTSMIETHPHPTAGRLPKVILSSQLLQNIHLDTALPTRGTRPSSTHQREGTSPSHQEACKNPMTNLTQQGADTKSKRNYNPAACGKETTNTKSDTK